MTWVKISDDFAEDCSSLSDAAFRTHVEALGWVMRRERGARFPKRELRRFTETRGDGEAAARELVEKGYWAEQGEEWEVVHSYANQPEPEVIAARRAADAERQRRARLRAAGIDPETGEVLPATEKRTSAPRRESQQESHRESRRDVTRDHPRDSGRVGSGRYGTGKDALDEAGDLPAASRDHPRDVTAGDDWPALPGAPVAAPVVRPALVPSIRPTCSDCRSDLTTGQHTQQQRARGTCGPCAMRQLNAEAAS